MNPVSNYDEVMQCAGREIGVSDWVVIDKSLINRFADITLDRYWVHVDPERASRELPDGKTIAHGLLIQSLVPALSAKVMSPGSYASARSYGTNRVRYPASAQVGDRVRLHTRLTKVKSTDKGVLVTLEHSMEIEGKAAPAMAAEGLTLYLGLKELLK